MLKAKAHGSNLKPYLDRKCSGSDEGGHEEEEVGEGGHEVEEVGEGGVAKEGVGECGDEKEDVGECGSGEEVVAERTVTREENWLFSPVSFAWQQETCKEHGLLIEKRHRPRQHRAPLNDPKTVHCTRGDGNIVCLGLSMSP